MNDITCVINGHREGYLARATIQSAIKTVKHARECGLKARIMAVLDNPDDLTRKVFENALGDGGELVEVGYGDLALSRNHAVDLAKSKYVGFLDGDDLWGKNWLVDAFLFSEAQVDECVMHPEFNIIFGGGDAHVFKHVDMLGEDFQVEDLYLRNYWTALSFSTRELYQRHPYRENTIKSGFGYEDWTWNFETIRAGIKHRVVKGTAHYIRKGKEGGSLLEYTNRMVAVPRIHNVYLNNTEKGAA